MSTINPILRHRARRLALQALYQWHVSATELSELEAQFLVNVDAERVDIPYFKTILSHVVNESTSFDNELAPHLSRAIAQIGSVEISILRIAVYELMHRPEIPYRVVLDEALRLSKTFGAEDAYKFINGVLDPLTRRLRAVEMTAQGNG